MGDKTRGLYNKFDVRRVDGSSDPGGKHHGCEYFVLDVSHDKHAEAALRAYADSCASEYPLLAADLSAKLKGRTRSAGIEQQTFGTTEVVPDMLPCMKSPVTVHAKQINEAFRVDAMEGNYKQGKAGDYLMRGIDGELYICDRSVFERTYRLL